MKKAFAALLCVLMLLALCSCGNKTSSVYTVGKYTVDTENGTISDGKYTYQYEFSPKTGGYALHITYPNGSYYWWNQDGTSGFGGFSDNYNDSMFASGMDLRMILEQDAPKEKTQKNVFIILVLIVFGAFFTITPYTAWQLESGWKFNNAEPSDIALAVNRISGIVMLVIALILIIS